MPPGDEGGAGAGDSSAPKDNNKKDSGSGSRKFPPRHGFQNKPVAPRQPKFEGKCDALKGHIYDCSDARQADLFTKTTNEIAEYVGRTFTSYGGDMRLAIEDMKLPTYPKPLIHLTMHPRRIFKSGRRSAMRTPSARTNWKNL
jgi:hypothetical protein